MLGNTRGAPGDGAPSTCGHTDSARPHTLSPSMAQRDPGHWVLGGQGSMAMSPPCQHCSACSPIPVLPRRGWWGHGQRAGGRGRGPEAACQRAGPRRGALAGGCLDFRRSALPLPAPPAAFRAYVRAPPPPPGSQGRAHRGHARSWAPGVGERPDPGLGRPVPAEDAARGGGRRLPPVSATRAYPGRDGGRAPPFCPRASLGAHLVNLSEARRAAELHWNYWSTK